LDLKFLQFLEPEVRFGFWFIPIPISLEVAAIIGGLVLTLIHDLKDI
jgi:hypothetical protein